MIGHDVGDCSLYAGPRITDLILFGTPGGHEPEKVYGRQLAALPEFAANYEMCNFTGEYPRGFNSRIYVRRNSPKIGIVQRPGRSSCRPIS
jgi:hypothetical protein